jgi:long-chain acyl-CoA synthetase
MNVANLLRNAARRTPEATAIAHGPRPVRSYRELGRRAAGLASAFAARCGLRPGDRVVLAMRNRPDYVEALFGLWHAGLVAVPVNARLHAEEIGFILESSGARLCLADDALAGALATLPGIAGGAVRLLGVETSEYAQLALAEGGAPAEVAPDDAAWLFYTSGTTGRPKGATLTHRNLMVMALAHLADIDRIRPGDTMIHAAPLSHGCGLWSIPNTAMGGTNVVLEGASYDPSEIVALLARYRRVSMYHAPTMLTRLVNDARASDGDFANLRTLIYGGSHMYRADLDRALALVGPKLVQIYGQGESPNTISLLSKEQHVEADHPRHEARLGSAGYARTGVEIRVADADGHDAPPGALGEVLVRGDIVMRGYWRDDEATARTLGGGWLHTGDLGTLDEDGLLTLKDRAKDMIISGGSNIYPREIEDVLLRHPAVLEASVVGRPHREWGEEAVAFVVVRAGAELSAAALDAHCLDHIARYKRPRDYRFVEALPKSGYNKILKTELRRRLSLEEG